MRVRELIELLEKMPAEWPVSIHSQGDRTVGEVLRVEICDAQSLDPFVLITGE